MISPASFADSIILHSFLFLVNLFFTFFSFSSGYFIPSLECLLNLPYLSLFVNTFFPLFSFFIAILNKNHA